MTSDNLKVGYVPNSTDLMHPGDRRRLSIWANAKGIILEIKSPTESDILVLSANANLNYWINRAKQPVVIDLVDGYLGESPNIFKDVTRNIIRAFNGKSNFKSITFTRELALACKAAAAVVVASPEQAEAVSKYNENVFVILDDHTELDQARQIRLKNNPNCEPAKQIFWEGFGFTLKHFKIINMVLDVYLRNNDYRLVVLTNTSFAKWGGYIGKVDTKKLFRKWFPLSNSNIEIIPWTIDSVIQNAARSDFAIIPVDVNDKFANLKPENKLLSMWHMGLPVLFSNTRAYERVAVEVGLQELCIKQGDWQAALAHFNTQTRNESITKAYSYIDTNHTRKILVSKWQMVIETVAEAHGDI
jgi:hypothetical protein